MRLPRDIGGTQLSKALSRFGYTVTRQTGSHIRLTTLREGEHHITIPAHNPIRVGTLNSILADVALHMGISKEEVLKSVLELSPNPDECCSSCESEG